MSELKRWTAASGIPKTSAAPPAIITMTATTPIVFAALASEMRRSVMARPTPATSAARIATDTPRDWLRSRVSSASRIAT